MKVRLSRLWTFSTFTLIVVGCTSQSPTSTSVSNPTPVIPAAAPRVLGTVDASFDTATQSAELRLKPRAALPDNSIGFSRLAFSDFVYDPTNTRYLFATFKVVNNTTAAFANLSLYAYTRPGTSVGGTALKNMVNFGGGAITLAEVAQRLLPTHKVALNGSSLTVDPANAEFQAFSSAEASAIQVASLGTSGSPLQSGDSVLEYGFVAHKNANSREIPGLPCGPATNPGCNEGTVTLAYKLPNTALSDAGRPYRFVASFVLGDAPTTRVTRSVYPPESGADALSRLNTLRGTNPGELLLLGSDDVVASSGVSKIVQANARISSAPTYLLETPSSVYGAALTPGPIPFPDGFMKSVKDYGAKGDGVTDDTAAIKAALADGRSLNQDYSGRPKALYFPAGTYLISDTLEWNGCCVTLQGQGSGSSVLKLKDSAAGFGTPSSPKPMVRTISGNQAFDQNIWDLGIDSGSGNPGAEGIDYIASNVGSLRNVRIVSSDGQGVRGLDMTRQWPGPLLIKNVQIEGFEVGIGVANAEYGPTFENIYLKAQRSAGIHNAGNTLAIRNLNSTNSVPAIQNTESYGSVILLDAKLEGGSSSKSAIENAGYLYARNSSSTGYSSLIGGVSGSSVTEYLSGTVKSLFSSSTAPKSLGLPIQETPVWQDPDLNNWGKFTADFYGDTSKLEALLNSGKSTVYFPSNVYFAFDERAVVVPAGVRRIVGFYSAINRGEGTNGGGIRFIVSDDSPEPLVIEGFKYGVKVEQRGKRPVALRNGSYEYTALPGAGDLYLEDVGIGPIRFVPGQRVWARQYNNESSGTKIVNDGAALWILGLKTENAGTVIETKNGGSSELLGTLIYPATSVPSSDVAFRSTDSRISLIYSVSSYVASGDYAIQVEETRAGVTKQLLQSAVGGRMPLFVGY